MHNRTTEQLQELFKRTKEKRLRQKEQEKARNAKIKAQEALRKREMMKHLAKLEKASQKPHIQATVTISIYNTRYIERYTADEDLFNTIQELKDYENELGIHFINWPKWNELVEQTRDMINAKG